MLYSFVSVFTVRRWKKGKRNMTEEQWQRLFSPNCSNWSNGFSPCICLCLYIQRYSLRLFYLYHLCYCFHKREKTTFRTKLMVAAAWTWHKNVRPFFVRSIGNADIKFASENSIKYKRMVNYNNSVTRRRHAQARGFLPIVYTVEVFEQRRTTTTNSSSFFIHIACEVSGFESNTSKNVYVS